MIRAARSIVKGVSLEIAPDQYLPCRRQRERDPQEQGRRRGSGCERWTAEQSRPGVACGAKQVRRAGESWPT